MNRPWRVDDYIAQLPRYGKKNPWIGTTGAGQNCPERESESPGEDIIVDDWSSVRTLPFLVPKLTPGRLTITGSSLIHRVIEAFRVYVRVQFTRTVCQSVNEPRHPSVALLFRLSRKAQCFAKPCSVSRRETRQGNKQFRDLRRAPCRRQTCAVHRMGPAAPELGLFFPLLEKAKRLHATWALAQRPGVLAFSCVFSLGPPAPERRRAGKNCKQLAHRKAWPLNIRRCFIFISIYIYIYM